MRHAMRPHKRFERRAVRWWRGAGGGRVAPLPQCDARATNQSTGHRPAHCTPDRPCLVARAGPYLFIKRWPVARAPSAHGPRLSPAANDRDARTLARRKLAARLTRHALAALRSPLSSRRSAVKLSHLIFFFRTCALSRSLVRTLCDAAKHRRVPRTPRQPPTRLTPSSCRAPCPGTRASSRQRRCRPS